MREKDFNCFNRSIHNKKATKMINSVMYNMIQKTYFRKLGNQINFTPMNKKNYTKKN